MRVSQWYRHMGPSLQYRDMWTPWWHRDLWMSPGYTGAGCVTPWPLLPLGQNGRGRWRHAVMASHHAGCWEAAQGPRGGLHALVPVPAAIVLHGSSCSGNRVLVFSGAEELCGGAPPPPGASPCPQRGGEGSANVALLHPAQIHKGYLDDPRNTDNAWVETVAVSVHFDNQNDVEMKRLNSVRAPHLHSSLTQLAAGMGQRSQISQPTSHPHQDWASPASCGGGRIWG